MVDTSKSVLYRLHGICNGEKVRYSSPALGYGRGDVRVPFRSGKVGGVFTIEGVPELSVHSHGRVFRLLLDPSSEDLVKAEMHSIRFKNSDEFYQWVSHQPA